MDHPFREEAPHRTRALRHMAIQEMVWLRNSRRAKTCPAAVHPANLAPPTDNELDFPGNSKRLHGFRHKWTVWSGLADVVAGNR
jgi:hypothetical protein